MENDKMKVKKVYYRHYRYATINGQIDFDALIYGLQHYNRRKTKWQPSTKGGKTECHLVLEDDSEIVGIAECSLQDNFNYKIGRQIAFGRAVKKYNFWLQQVAMQKADWVYTCTITE